MNAPTVATCAPEELSHEDLETFKHFVVAGGEVNVNTLSQLLPRARSLGLVRLDRTIVAVGALKRPNEGYRDRVFAKADLSELAKNFEYELGWVYVHPSARGRHLSSLLVQNLVTNLGSSLVYATSRVDNEAMHVALEHAGFKEAGSPYPSQVNDPNLQLFLRQ